MCCPGTLPLPRDWSVLCSVRCLRSCPAVLPVLALQREQPEQGVGLPQRTQQCPGASLQRAGGHSSQAITTTARPTTPFSQKENALERLTQQPRHKRGYRADPNTCSWQGVAPTPGPRLTLALPRTLPHRLATTALACWDMAVCMLHILGAEVPLFRLSPGSPGLIYVFSLLKRATPMTLEDHQPCKLSSTASGLPQP